MPLPPGSIRLLGRAVDLAMLKGSGTDTVRSMLGFGRERDDHPGLQSVSVRKRLHHRQCHTLGCQVKRFGQLNLCLCWVCT
jgi:hypothetical protein